MKRRTLKCKDWVFLREQGVWKCRSHTRCAPIMASPSFGPVNYPWGQSEVCQQAWWPLPIPLGLPDRVKSSVLHRPKKLPQKKRNKYGNKKGEFLTPSSTQMWFGSDNKPSAYWSTIVTAPAYTSITCWAPEKMILWGKRYFWKLSPTESHKTYARCTICHKYNLGKTLHGLQGHFPFPKKPCLQMPPSQGY